MPPITLRLPTGMYRNGTPYTRKGRWVDGNLVRWHSGSVRPIGGWLRRQSAGVDIATLIADPTLEAVRDMFAWRDNNQNQNTVFGSNLALYHMNQGGVITDITYAGYTPNNSSKNAQVQAGYGQNPYGFGAYGQANNLTGQDPIPPDRWYFGNFGEILLTGVRNNGGLYELDLGTVTLSAVANAPSTIQDLVVTEERQVFVIGGDGEPRRLQTSDNEDRTMWTPAIDNQVIDRVIPGSGRLLRCIQVLRTILLLGENDAYTARYIGPPYVYGVDLAGENCGLIAAEAVARTDRFAAWWGERNFWIFDGSVQQIECDVLDYLDDDIDPTQIGKICAFSNTDYSEITWLYQSQSTTTTEVDSYVTWNYRDNHWSTGRIDRTVALDKGTLLYPVMVDSDGYIYNHEQKNVLPDGAVFAKTGMIELGDGDKNMAVRYIWPDTENTNDVQYTLYGKQFPNNSEITFGPYSYNNPVPTRAIGRSIAMRVDFLTATSELGIQRLEVAPTGTGKR